MNYRWYDVRETTGRTIRYCWETQRRSDGYFHAFRQVVELNGTEQNDQFVKRKVRSKLAARQRLSAEKHAQALEQTMIASYPFAISLYSCVGVGRDRNSLGSARKWVDAQIDGRYIIQNRIIYFEQQTDQQRFQGQFLASLYPFWARIDQKRSSEIKSWLSQNAKGLYVNEGRTFVWLELERDAILYKMWFG